MVELHEIGRLPAPNDNCAIAIRILAQNTAVATANTHFTLSHTILEGHRFAVQAILAGDALLSWGMPFGKALRDIQPGEYVCNAGVLEALSSRGLDFVLPSSPNFADDLATYQFDAAHFKPAPPLPHSSAPPHFMGLQRPGKRGVGTRNMIVLLGVNALVGGFVQQLEKALKTLAESYENIDDIMAVAHTEGSQAGGNNQELLLRTLAGFGVHPNVGAVLILDASPAGVTNDMLRDYAQKHGYPLVDVLHRFMSLGGSFVEDLARATAVVNDWLPQVNAMQRTPQPLSELKIALQCGGSDAFSGISGNPLAAWVSKEVIQCGGSAVLAETDELIGAESYVLQKVRDSATAESFLQTVAHFQTQAAWHGHSAHGNPSGGNLYRGLYNIYLKSLGAATKRHPTVRLDYVIKYGEQMSEPGYYFMDSPGNDLESIAGQVASGCNLIYFVTGNGSITNFPFVPTIKIVTTSERYALLPGEMDVNAGAFLDGTPLPMLGKQTLDLTVNVASGQLTVGEVAGHAQVQIWRNWQQTAKVDLTLMQTHHQPDGQPLPLKSDVTVPEVRISGWKTEQDVVSDQVGLILPTSLCSGQIARMAVQRLNAQQYKHFSHYATLVHTEGCGSSTQREYVDTILGYLAHPLVADCLLLEHGCEKTHNDYWRVQMRRAGLDPNQFGWASVQLDGGIEKVLTKIETWFEEQSNGRTQPQRITTGLEMVRLGLVSTGDVNERSATSLAQLTQTIVAAGGTVVVTAHDDLLAQAAFRQLLPLNALQHPSLAYAQQTTLPGFHIMDKSSSNWTEMLTGLGATGVELVLALVGDRPQAGHPLIPVLQVGSDTAVTTPFQTDLDAILTGDSKEQVDVLLNLLVATLSQIYTPRANLHHNVDFQITRGLLGVSL